MASQSFRLKEEQLRKEEEKLKEIELRVQREISEKRQELLAKEESLRNMEVCPFFCLPYLLISWSHASYHVDRLVWLMPVMVRWMDKWNSPMPTPSRHNAGKQRLGKGNASFQSIASLHTQLISLRIEFGCVCFCMPSLDLPYHHLLNDLPTPFSPPLSLSLFYLRPGMKRLVLGPHRTFLFVLCCVIELFFDPATFKLSSFNFLLFSLFLPKDLKV